MWTCPKCGREFKNNEQSHYCILKPETIDEYIEMQDDDKKERLYLIRETMRNALPEAKECISWSMPTYKREYNIAHFACFKKHIGFYPGPAAVEHFSEKLSDFKWSKGSIQFPYNKKLPVELIREICLWCYETGNHA